MRRPPFYGFVNYGLASVEHESRQKSLGLWYAVLPAYHRLDVSIERTFVIGRTDLTLMTSVINAYNRRNIFSLDVFSLERVDQLPLVPSVGLRVAFR